MILVTVTDKRTDVEVARMQFEEGTLLAFAQNGLKYLLTDDNEITLERVT